MIVNEIQIPVPWGVIAAKAWGNNNNPLILGIHGWADNANTFDNLIPLLSDSYYYFCIDLPGHGKSSHLQTSLFLHDADFVLVIKIVYDFLKRDKIMILCHSFGALLGLHFTQYFPKCVSKLICLDVIYYYPRNIINQYRRFNFALNVTSRALQKTNKREFTYTKEEAIQRFLLARLTKISKESMEILADRNLEHVGNDKYRITIAPQIRLLHPSYVKRDDIVKIIKRYPIKCPHFIVLTTESYHLKLALKDVHEEFKKNPGYEFHVVQGNHEVHLENPERIASLINNFLSKQRNKL